MRVLIVTSGFPAFLEQVYRSRPELARLPYARQREELLFESSGWSDAYALAFRQLGHEAETLVANAEALQICWAEEHGMGRVARELRWLTPASPAARSVPPLTSLLRARRKRLFGDIFLAQVETYRPDILYVQLQTSLPASTIRAAREYTRVTVAQLASRFPAYAELYGVYDLIVSAFPHYVRMFNECGLRSAYLPQAFQPLFLERCRTRYGDVTQMDLDAVFVGSISDQHIHRIEWLNAIASSEDVVVFLALDRLHTIPELPEPLRSRHRPPVYGLAMLDVYRRARIVLNAHPEIAGPYASIMRLYEATGAGAMLLTDEKKNLDELFAPGREVITYTDTADAVAKLEYYLLHEDERAEIAAAGQQRTLTEHTYEQRVAQLLIWLEPWLG